MTKSEEHDVELFFSRILIVSFEKQIKKYLKNKNQPKGCRMEGLQQKWQPCYKNKDLSTKWKAYNKNKILVGRKEIVQKE